MTTLYLNPGIWKRTYAYGAVIIAAMAWGVFELWNGSRSAGGDAQSDALFGVLFIGGGIYAIWQMMTDWRDVIVSLERDDAGALIAKVWSLTGAITVDGPFTDWRYHVTLAGRRSEVPWIYVNTADWERPLRIDLRQKADLTGLRTVAAEAVADYDARKPAAGMAK
jgi:hypothetical protein